MTPALTIEFCHGLLERIGADLAVVGWAPEDRPLRGAAGRVDWRLCGELWTLCSSEKLSGAVGDAVLLPTGGALHAPLLLAVGLGARSDLGVGVWREVGRDALSRALGLRVERVALGLASDAVESDPQGLEALLCGAAMAVAEREGRMRVLLVQTEGEPALSRLGSLALDGFPSGVEVRIAGSPELSTNFPV